jgi:hypothetical protein
MLVAEVLGMAGPRDEMATGVAGHGHMRASHADRERVIDVLKTAFVQGRLAKDEFDLRVGQALVSRTGAELAALTTDIPAGLTAARPPRFPAPVWLNKKTALVCVTAGAVSLFALPYLVTVLTGGGPLRAQTVVFLVVVLTVFSVPLAAVLLRAWLGKRRGYATGYPGPRQPRERRLSPQ